jgi:hypothetical protein
VKFSQYRRDLTPLRRASSHLFAALSALDEAEEAVLAAHITEILGSTRVRLRTRAAALGATPAP